MKEVFNTLQQGNIVKGAMATCACAAPVPAMMNVTLGNNCLFYNGKLTATTLTLGPCFPSPGFGVCNAVPNLPKPCACMITKWDFPDNAVKANRVSNPLTTLSKGSCALSPVPMCISFVIAGQIPFPDAPGFAAPECSVQSNVGTVGQNKEVPKVPQLIKIHTFDSGGNPIDVVPEDGYVTLVADTINHEIGDAVIFDVDGIGKFTGYVEKTDKACVLFCYFGPVWNDVKDENKTNDETKPSSAEPKDKIADALLDNPEALELIDLQTLGRDAWDKPNDGFKYIIENDPDILQGLTLTEFLDLYKRSSMSVANMKDDNDQVYTDIDGYEPTECGEPLTQEEQKKLLEIRKELYKRNVLNQKTVFQKVVCCDKNFESWLKSANEFGRKGPLKAVGSVILAKDGKHLKTPNDLYDGLQLNYGKPEWNPYHRDSKHPENDPKCYYVLRYTTKQPENAKIPVHDKNEIPDNIKGTRDDFEAVSGNKYPFRGAGYTPATKENRIGTPELFDPYEEGRSQEIDKAIIVRIDEDGTETIVGYKKLVEVEVEGEDKKKYLDIVPQYVCVE